MTVRDVLVAARALIAEPWIPGPEWRSFRDLFGAVDAVDKVSGIDGPDATAASQSHHWTLRRQALNAVTNSEGRPINEWKADPERTHADVLAAFDRAIKVTK